jgi:hypothetical protein
MSTNAVVSWEEIENVLGRMFRVWSSGGEVQWAKECWRYFEKEGLTSAASAIEGTRSRLRLLTLAKIYEEFSGYMWDENPDTPLVDLSEDLEIDRVALGAIAGEDPTFFDEEPEESDALLERALAIVVDQLRPEIHSCLVDAYGGEGGLYQRMARTTESTDAEDPDSSPSFEFTPTGNHVRAWAFISNSFQSP